MYAIVDIETTGGYSAQNRITEVAVVIHDGTHIVDSYQTLLNPERNIPSFITGLTGISSAMVQDAPVFAEIAEELYALLSGKVFVAHNVNFDYSFIREEFRNAGFDFNLNKLCTVRLSRQIIPGLKSYSLGRICEYVGIPITNRHRAYGDAEATARLFDNLLKKDSLGLIAKSLKRNSGTAFLPPNISMEQYQKLPESAGVYYFHDQNGQVIYVGKALNIKARFKGHFSGTGKLKQSIGLEIHSISYELTGSEFLALLLEALEIKRLWPKYNKAQKRRETSWGIYNYVDSSGYQRFQISKTSRHHPPISFFNSHGEAWALLMEKMKKHRLCPKLCGIQKSPAACHDYRQGSCLGACCGTESIQDYNERCNKMVAEFLEENKKLLIREEGREEGEQAAILFENGLLSAFGFIDSSLEFQYPQEVIPVLKKVKPVKETNYILRSYLYTMSGSNVHVLPSTAEGGLFSGF